MTNERKIDGWCAMSPSGSWMLPSTADSARRTVEQYNINLPSWMRTPTTRYSMHPVRVIPATEPTPAEAAAAERKRVIGEVREYLEDDKRSYEESEKMVGEGSYANEIAVLANALSKLNQLEGEE